MFLRPFHFTGRVGRLEYGLSCLIVCTAIYVANTFPLPTGTPPPPLVKLLYILLFLFVAAQGAKRCHDRGNSGWYLLIPLYAFWLLWAVGAPGTNQYGPERKRRYRLQRSNDHRDLV